MHFIKIYLITFIIFFAIDLVWLGLVANGLYQQHLGYLMKSNVNWVAAILFYLLFIGGLVFFVLLPGIEKDSYFYVMGAGALFGLIAYATYDMTNLATIKNWPLFITVVDLIWGTFVCFLTSTISFFIIKTFFK